MDCKKCDNFMDNVPIKIVHDLDINPLMEENFEIKMGYKCTWNGMECLDIEKLKVGGCRCEPRT